MVVEAHDEWRRCVCGLQILVELIDAIAIAVVVECERFVWIARHHARDRQCTFGWAKYAALIDVIAVVVDAIEALLGEAAPSCVKSIFIFLTARNGEAHLRDLRARWWQRACAPYTTALGTRLELIVIIAARFET